MYEVGNVNKATTVKAWSGPKQLQNVQSKTELRQDVKRRKHVRKQKVYFTANNPRESVCKCKG